MIVELHMAPNEAMTYEDQCDIKAALAEMGWQVDFIGRFGHPDARKYQDRLHKLSPPAATQWSTNYMRDVD